MNTLPEYFILPCNNTLEKSIVTKICVNYLNIRLLGSMDNNEDLVAYIYLCIGWYIKDSDINSAVPTVSFSHFLGNYDKP